MTDLPMLILGVLASLFKSRAKLEAEILVLRQQINVLRRRAPKRPHLNNTDRFLFVWLYHWFPSVLGAIAIVRPETIIRGAYAGLSDPALCMDFASGWPRFFASGTHSRALDL
jgi:hypothetical protein